MFGAPSLFWGQDRLGFVVGSDLAGTDLSANSAHLLDLGIAQAVTPRILLLELERDPGQILLTLGGPCAHALEHSCDFIAGHSSTIA